MSEYSKLSLAVSSAAFDDAGLDTGAGSLAGCCGLLGTTHGSTGFCEAYYGAIVRDGLSASNPVLFAEGVPNAAAAHLSMSFGLTGSCQTLIGTRSAGLHALALAAMRIREGLWTRAIVSAAEEYSPIVNAAYQACGLYGGSSGFAVGSGSVAVVIESRRIAEARGAQVRGEVGPVSWAERPEPESVTDNVRKLSDVGPAPVCVWSSLGPGAADRLAAALLERSNTGVPHRSVYGALPELFSVGPLAALAAGLICESSDFAVISREFQTHSCGLLVRKPVSLP
jgi:3-oxoacyl-[acyl-carrier-protein] synthase II